MNRFAVFVGLMAIVLALDTIDAEACSRCGRSGDACHFAGQSKAKDHAAKSGDVVVVNTLIGVPVATNYGFIAPQGNTIYGYGSEYPSLSSFAASFNQGLDYAVLFKRADQLANNALGLADKAVSGSQQLLAVKSAGDTEVAKILAQGQAAAAALLAARSGDSGGGSDATGSLVFKTTVDQATGEVRVDQEIVPRAADLKGFVVNNCVVCHVQKGVKLDLAGIDSFSLDQLDHVIDRLTTVDSAKRMPPGRSLKPGELGLFYGKRAVLETDGE